eukprot:COSAG01_NODE_11787_length_1857_cov_9.354747_3_plen_152_part_01
MQHCICALHAPRARPAPSRKLRPKLGRAMQQPSHAQQSAMPPRRDAAGMATVALLALVERPDIWTHIACHMGGDELWRARRVNRGLRSACEAELARLHELSLVRYYRNVDDVVVRVVATRCTQLTSLNLNRCSSVTDEGLRTVAASCTQLTS